MEVLEGDTFLVTGVDRNGKRFSRSFKHMTFIYGINLWRGSRWLVRDGKRKLISRVYN